MCAVCFLAATLSPLVSLRAQIAPSVSVPVPVNVNAGSDSGIDEQPDVATDGNGTWIAVWSSTEDIGGSLGADRDVLVSRSTDNGVTWSIPIPVNSDAVGDPGEDFWVSIVTDRTDHWLVAWVSNNDLNDFDIRYAKSTDNGVSWSTLAVLNSNGGADNGDDTAPNIVLSENGILMAVWQSTENLGGTAGTDNDILYATSSDFGATWSTPATLNSNATTDTGADTNPHISTDNSGKWVAVWQSTENLGGTIGVDDDILTSISTNDGGQWSAPTVVNTNATTDTANDEIPSIATDANGAWSVAWQSAENLGGTIGTDRDILFARSTDDAATWSTVVPLNGNATTDIGEDFFVQLAQVSTTDYFAIWYSSDALSGTIGVDLDYLMSQSSDSGASWTSPLAFNSNATTDTGNDSLQRLTSDGFDNWMVAWMTTDVFGGTIGIDSDIVVATFPLPDCNGNGVGDRRDVRAGTSVDCNGNSVPDECEGGCPNAPVFGTPLCAVLDTDDDGVNDCDDRCANTPGWGLADARGCSCSQLDDDDDGVDNCGDQCPDIQDIDSDGDSVADCVDQCPNDSNKSVSGVCGCGVTDSDMDADGTPDCVDACPNNPDRSDPGNCDEASDDETEAATDDRTETPTDDGSIPSPDEPSTPVGPVTDPTTDNPDDSDDQGPTVPIGAFCGSGTLAFLVLSFSGLGLFSSNRSRSTCL